MRMYRGASYQQMFLFLDVGKLEQFWGHRLWGASPGPERKYKIHELARPVSAVEMALSVLLTDSDLCRIPTGETDDASCEVTQSYYDLEKVFSTSEESCTT